MKTTTLHVYIQKPAPPLNSAVVLFEFFNLGIHHSDRYFSFLYLLGLNFPTKICSQEDLGSSFTHCRAALHIKRTPSITCFHSILGFPQIYHPLFASRLFANLLRPGGWTQVLQRRLRRSCPCGQLEQGFSFIVYQTHNAVAVGPKMGS